MRTRTFIGLVVVTAAVAAGAWWSIQEREAGVRPDDQRGPLVPGLLDRVNDIDHVRIETAEHGVVTIRREDGVWVVEEAADYPAVQDRVARALLRAARLERVEPMTARAENYPRLGVAPIDTEGSQGVRLTMLAGTERVADFIVGLPRSDDAGSGVFVRQVDEDRAWLADSDWQPDPRMLRWLDRNIVNVDSRRVSRVEITHPDGESVAITRDAFGDQVPFELTSPVPEGRTPAEQEQLRTLAQIPQFLIFEDVKPAGRIEAGGGAPVVATFETFDGLRIVMEAVEDEEGTIWVSIEAMAGHRDERVDDYVEEHAGEDSAAGRTADQLRAAGDVDAQIDRITDRTADWAYQLTGFKTRKVTSRPEDVTQRAEDPAAALDDTPQPAGN